MSTVVVRHYLYGPGQTGVPRRRCTVTLTGAGLWLSNETGEIIDSAAAESDDTGLVEITVTPNAEIAGPDSYYVFRISNTDVARAFVAPVSAAAVKLVDCLVDETTLDPVDPDLPSLYLARAELGAANGVAPLVNGKVPAENLPPGSGGSVPDATTLSKGIVQLAGDLAGTAAAPTVPGLATKASSVHGHVTGDITGLTTFVTALVDTAIAAVIDSAPGTLDTLNELAAALGDDPAFATTITTLISGRIPASTVAAKGDLLAGSAAGTVVRVPVGTGGQVVIADPSQSSGLRWTAQDRGWDPLDAVYGWVAANGTPADFRDPSAMGTNGWISAVFVPAGVALTTVWCGVHTAGTIGAGGTNGFAVYDSTGTMIGSTPSDDTLFASTGLRSKALSAPIAASTSRRIVYVEMRREGWSVEPVFAFLQTANNAGLFDGGCPSGVRKSFIVGGTGHPASINPATTGSGSSGYLPFIAFS